MEQPAERNNVCNPVQIADIPVKVGMLASPEPEIRILELA
jgi:hypothetical protein